MPPKGKGKKRDCLRCPADTDDAIKCTSTIKCKAHIGEYANIENLWPNFPSDDTFSVIDDAAQDSQAILEVAEAGDKDYLHGEVTKQMLEHALKTMQRKGKIKAAKAKVVASSSSAATSSTSAAGPDLPTYSRVLDRDPKSPVKSEPLQTPSVEPHLSSLQELTLGDHDHPSTISRSVTTPLVRPQMRLELNMPTSSDHNQNQFDIGGNLQDCREEWKEKMPQFSKQCDELDDPLRTLTLRSGFANSEKDIMVRSNHFVVKLDKSKDLYEYEIEGIPASASKGKKRDMVETMMLNIPALRDQADDYATDFKKKIIAWKDLFAYHASEEDPEKIATILDIPGHPDNNGNIPTAKLELVFQRRLSVDDLNDYVQGRKISFANTGIIEALNILISKGVSEANAQSIEVGTNRYYYKPGHTPLSDKPPESTGLVAIRGYFASIRPGMGKVLLNVNTVMGAFYEAVTVDKILKILRNEPKKATQFLKGVRVRIQYDRAHGGDKGKQVAGTTFQDAEGESIDSERRRTKCIWGFGSIPSKQTFIRNGKPITVTDYFRETYPNLRRLSDENILVNLGNDAQPSWFPAEHLHILPYQLYKSKLDPVQVAAMIKIACRNPEANRKMIMSEGLPSIGITGALPRVLQQMNMEIDKRMIDVPAYGIEMPRVECRPKGASPFSTDRITKDRPDAFGFAWEMLRSAPIKVSRQYPNTTHTSHLIAGSSTKAQRLQYICTEFNRVMRDYGLGEMNLSIRHASALPQMSPEEIAIALSTAKAANAGLVVLILPSSGSADAGHYRYFKSECDQKYGFKSICMAIDKLENSGLQDGLDYQTQGKRGTGKGSRGPGSYMIGVALKLNIKLGNWNWEVAKGDLRELLVGPGKRGLHTLILGADVTHPSPGSTEGTPSIAAVVGNADEHCGRMPGSMRRQTGKEEIIEALSEMVEERLRDWNRDASRQLLGEYVLPAHILYYRDGVSESQFETVKARELPQIRDAWARAAMKTRKIVQMPNVFIPQDVSITCVIVSKRHNTRFYPPTGSPLRDDLQNTRAKGNLKPGTVVESVVTTPYWHDFYLNSHFGLQGTVRPCHYIVLHDDNKMTAGDLQKLTFLLCHMYQRAMCSVSYATPTYYADRLCERGRHYLADFFDGRVDVEGLTETVVQDMLDNLWWRGGDRSRKNPWHANLDGTMFWL